MSARKNFCSSLAELGWSVPYKGVMGLEFAKLMQTVISLLDHCRVMLKWEGLLPEILNSGTVRKRSTPGKKRVTQQALRGPSMAEMVVEMKNATHKLQLSLKLPPQLVPHFIRAVGYVQL